MPMAKVFDPSTKLILSHLYIVNEVCNNFFLKNKILSRNVIGNYSKQVNDISKERFRHQISRQDKFYIFSNIPKYSISSIYHEAMLRLILLSITNLQKSNTQTNMTIKCCLLQQFTGHSFV